jgi:drug/metabolite transporter (DMT)-like permease
VASIRILSAGIILLPVAIRQFRKIPPDKWALIFISGLLGSFFPAYLFCIAETKIDSSLASFFNALTPIFTLLLGILFFKNNFRRNQWPGVLIGFAGMALLFAGKGADLSTISYSSFVLFATLCYAVNANMVSWYLKDVGSVNIAAMAFGLLIIPSFLILFITGFFDLPLDKTAILMSSGAGIVLGVLGTAIASILFYALLKRAGVLFTSMVTYGIPFVALFWGLIAGENINIWQVIGLGIILSGVYLTNR